MTHKINEVYIYRFNFRDHLFLEPPFDFYLIFCQTILIPLLQAQYIWFKNVSFDEKKSEPFFQLHAGSSLGSFLNEILVTKVGGCLKGATMKIASPSSYLEWYGQIFWRHQNCYLPPSLVRVYLVIPLYQVHTSMPWQILLHTPLCTHDRHFSHNIFRISL